MAGECHSNTGGMPNTIFVWQGFPRARELEARRQGTSQQDRGGWGGGGRTSFFESCTLQDPPNNISCQIYSHIGPGLVTNKSLKYGRAAAFTSGLRPAVIQSCGAIAAAGGCVTSFQFHGSSH